MKRYTILHTIETGGPGGAETVLLTLVRCLDPNHFRSVVLLPSVDWLYAQLQEAGIPTHVVQSSRWHDFGIPRALAALARREKADLIHSHLPDQNFYSAIVGKLTGRPVVVTYHGSQQLSNPSSLKSAVKLMAVSRGASAIVVVSDYLGQLLKQRGVPAHKIVRIHNGIDLDRFATPATGGLRGELGCEEGDKVVGMVANVRGPKGYEYFLKAARLVADRMPATRFVSIGDANHGSLGGLLRLRAELNLQERFSFLGFRKDAHALLRDLDVFVLSSITEGFSLATAEAMGAGRPVVVTRSGGPQELVEDGVTGLLVPPADAQSLADAIYRVLSSPTLATDLGRRAEESIRQKFTIQQTVAAYGKVYEDCLNTC